MIDRTLLEAHRAEYQAALEKAIADSNANSGAIQALDRLLVLLENPRPENEQNEGEGT